jgi:hypothetical protein
MDLRTLLLLIPAAGYEGAAAVREAAATELRQINELVRSAIAKAQGRTENYYVQVEAWYRDHMVVMQDGRLYRYGYAIGEDNQVVLAAPEEVVVQHVPVRESAQGALLEAAGGEPGLRYRIRVIKAGLSGNRNFYSDDALRDAVPLFEGVRCFVKSDEEHIRGGGKDFSKLIGRLTEAKFVPGSGADAGEIQATLDLLASAAPVPAKIHEAWQRGIAGDLFGFSIDAKASIESTVREGKPARAIRRFTKVNSLDLIIEPGAGGEIINLIEAIHDEGQQDMNWLERVLEALKAANGGTLPAGLDTTNEQAVTEALNAAVARQPSPGGLDRTAVTDMIACATRVVEARADMRVLVAGSGLPEAARKRVEASFANRDNFTADEVREALKTEREYIASFGGGQVRGLGEHSLIEAGDDRADRVVQMLDAFFDPAKREVMSIKECYIEITGDRLVTGRIENCDRVRLRESMPLAVRESLDTTSWANVLGNSIRRRLIADYAQNNRYSVWRDLVTVVPVPDFRTNERTRYGGYGDLPTVAQGAAYAALSSPTDEKASYAVAKRGGTEDVTIEMIKNDDVGAIMRIPTRLTLAAQRTLSKFVLDFIRTNPTIYDTVALFHATHGNLSSTALGAASLAAARLAVLKQTELTSADRIGIPPVFLWVPFDQEEAAFDLFRRQTNNDSDFVESLQMKVRPVWYWTDTNDWAVSCDPREVPTIEIGFLDGNETPELFVQDSPTVGSLFSHDKLTYKIRHIYGGDVVDFRGLHKAVVA